MKKEQQAIMHALGINPVINPTEEIRKRIDFLKDYCKTARANGFVLGISGGQDSTLAGRLAQLAVNELRQEGFPAMFIAVRLPYGKQKDEKDAQMALRFIQADHNETFNIKSTVDAFEESYNITEQPTLLSDYHKGNAKARTRMMVHYAIAGERNLLVIGTDHAAESVTGFFTKFGDGAADILPLSGLTKRQGKQLLIALGAPEALYLKVPTADLLDNSPQQTDETELGISYDELDDFLEGKVVSDEVTQKIITRYKLSKHKRTLPITPFDSL